MSQIVAATVAAIASMVREYTLTTYRIVGAKTPVFMTPEKAFVAPDSEFVSTLAASEETAENVIFKVEGEVWRTYGVDAKEDVSAQGRAYLPVTAEKYAHPAFSFTLADDGTTVIITLPIFKKGPPEKKVKPLKLDAPSMVGLLTLKKATPETVAASTPATPETVAETLTPKKVAATS